MKTADGDRLEDDVQRIGREIIDAAGREEYSIRPSEWFDARIMEWAMGDEALKVELLRFIDVLPALRSPEEIAQHLEEYFAWQGSDFPVAAQWGIHLLAQNPLGARAAAAMVRSNAERMAQRFIAGATVPEVVAAVRRMRKDRMAFTVDVLGEATVSQEEAVAYQTRYLDVLAALAAETAGWKPDNLLDSSEGRTLPRASVSVKLSSLFFPIETAAPEFSSQAIRDRLRPILNRAMELNAAVTLDMEQYALKNLTLQVFRDLLDEPAFRHWAHCGIAIQAYLRESEEDVRSLIEWAKSRPSPISVRLVRGAYWDYETVVAEQRGWPIPVFTEKAGTDRSYERCLRLLIEAYPVVNTAAATHNVRSLALLMALHRALGLPEGASEVQMLYGMADSLKRVVIGRGHRLRVYTPFGELLPGMAYLVRRLLENTSNSSFLRMRFNENAPMETLLGPPPALPPPERKSGPADSEPRMTPYTPERDFSQPDQRAAFAAAVDRVRGMLGGNYAAIIDGEEIWTDECVISISPSHPSTVVGRTSSASESEAENAVQAALRAFPGWRESGFEARAGVLKRAASIMRGCRDDLAAWEVFEVGKSWSEADADVAESIDYLEYYAAEMLRLGPPRLMDHVPGETNYLHYEPRGVVAVIPPWNFPLAILTGMTSAALVTGNTVVLKPASQSPIIGAHFTRILHEAGVPPGVLNLLPGPGGEIGDYLVDRPRVSMIAFTGSREVGQRIFRRAAETQKGQVGLKYVIAEMGGKNAVIVDRDADLDDAVLGVVASAFGYQGQKCSACSRVICIGDAYEPFLARLVEAARSLRIGPSEDPSFSLGPVIDDRARERIFDSIRKAKETAAPVLEVDASGCGDGCFVGPVIFGDVDPDSFLAQEEIFGPVLSVFRASDLDQAIRIANGTLYALTGGLYSRSPATVARARQELQVGNLYINRKITGAIVGRQPFGGFKMSGTDIKAGGPDYLMYFMQARTITENTLRRGFAPSSDQTLRPPGSR